MNWSMGILNLLLCEQYGGHLVLDYPVRYVEISSEHLGMNDTKAGDYSCFSYERYS